MIQAILALIFFFSFSERAKILQKDKWSWGLAGALCFFATSWGISELLARAVQSSALSSSLGILLPLVVIGIGLACGYALTEQIKSRVLAVDSYTLAKHQARRRTRTGGSAAIRPASEAASIDTQPAVTPETERFRRGVRLLTEGNAEGALSEFRASLANAVADRKADSLYNIAICHLRLGNIGEAREAAEKAIALDPDLMGDMKTDQDFTALLADEAFRQVLGRASGTSNS